MFQLWMTIDKFLQILIDIGKKPTVGNVEALDTLEGLCKNLDSLNWKFTTTELFGFTGWLLWSQNKGHLSELQEPDKLSSGSKTFVRQTLP